MTEFDNRVRFTSPSIEQNRVIADKDNCNNTLHKTIGCASDAFRMKAYSLIKRHNVHFSSVKEALENIKKATIQTSIGKNSLVSMQLSLSLPTETILIKGSFEQDQQLRSRVIPVKESFELIRSTHY